jgi:hypothetical protein
MSTKYDVCLVVTTQSATLSELTARTGVEAADGSHNMGDPHRLKTRGLWKQTIWKVCSTCSQSEPLEAHFDDIVAQLSAEKLRAPDVLPNAAKVYFSVGVFSDDQIPTADFTFRCLAISQSYGASIEVCLYSCDMTEQG